MLSNILNFLENKRKIKYSIKHLVMYSTSTYLISISILCLILIPKYFNKYILKYILPIIITSVLVCFLEIYLRLSLKQNLKPIFTIPVTILHFIPLYYWFKLNSFSKIKHIYFRLIFYNLLIGSIITSIYYLTDTYPYYMTPLEISIIGLSSNLLFYYTFTTSSSS